MLVLSGGGARGIAHIGAIEELEEQGFEITALAGTSMGALVGGVYALGKLTEFKEWMLTLDKMKVFSLVDFTFSGQGLVKGDKVLDRIMEMVPDEPIEDLELPYAAVAVDLLKGIGAAVIPLYCESDGTFPNHEANPLKAENLVDVEKGGIEIIDQFAPVSGHGVPCYRSMRPPSTRMISPVM